MSRQVWTNVDAYLTDLLIPEEAGLESAHKASADAGLPAIAVSPAQGKLLHLLARTRGARRILEIGTLGGYSAIWLGRALPEGGRLITLEVDRTHAEVARANISEAGLSSKVEVRLGPARESLTRMIEEKSEPFDLIFIDADKHAYPEYWSLSLKLSRPGTLIIADNVVRDGAVADAGSKDAAVQGVRRYLSLVAAEPRVSGTVLQTVGAKGYDGISLAMVLDDADSARGAALPA